ncbi:hypothetical protein [Aliikangiella sp. G2MR2-5]|uniref:hypothetical protein n=1 Tax=Aliikangiella sp. G2MR2-5 TaxID=2788943 RepID=UPI0018AA3742|nr:hypothetical protein [Aliikangiella sp. G2MR2-5]
MFGNIVKGTAPEAVKNNSQSLISSKRLNRSLLACSQQPVFKLKPIVLCICMGIFGNQVLADDNEMPTGGRVTHGEGIITESGLLTTINQNSSSLVIDWNTFNLGVNGQVDFVQPDANAIALNRILDVNPSQIFGSINANGHVVLLNPNGILFGETASVNVGGMIASSLSISPEDFMNGNYVFSDLGELSGSVVNHGVINAASGGSVALLGSRVENHGLIAAQLGSVNLAAGREAVLTFDRMGLLGVRVTEAVLQEDLGVDPAVLNTGEITAAGGKILLTGSVSEDIFSQAVNLGEFREAEEVIVHEDGSFTLGGRSPHNAVNYGEFASEVNLPTRLINIAGTSSSHSTRPVAGGGDVVNSGTIDVSTTAEGDNAGQITLLGENVSSSGYILANAESGQAGNIRLEASQTTQLVENSVTSATATGATPGQGGNINLLGTNVGLFDQSIVDASGLNGGEVLIGGDQQGLNSLITNAEFTFIDEDVQVFADGLQSSTTGSGAVGDGGRIIVFAEDTSRIYGNLFARGGADGGDGGFIETSGLVGFEISSAPDASASNGLGGEWLIDPNNIEIIAGSGSTGMDSGNPFTSDTDGAQLGVDLIIAALTDNGVNVTVQTGAGGSEEGNITLNTSLDLNDRAGNDNSNPPTLTLSAHNNIIINQAITDTDGAGPADMTNLVFIADYDGNGVGDVNINANITSRIGNIDISGVNINVADSAAVDSDGGNIAFDATNTITLGTDSDVVSDGGTILLQAGGAITAGALSDVVSDGGNVTITGASVDLSGAVNATGSSGQNGGDITISATDVSGTITTSSLSSSGGSASNQNGFNGGNITLTAGSNITVNGTIQTNGSNGEDPGGSATAVGGDAGTVSISSTSGIVTLSDINANGGDADAGGGNPGTDGGNGSSVTLSGTSLVLNGDISATGGAGANGGSQGNGANITLDGPVTLAADSLSIDASGATNGNICFADDCDGPTSTHTIDGNGTNAANLSLTGNNILFTGNIGDTNSAGSVTINATGSVNASGLDITASSLNVQNSSSFTSGNIDTSGVTDGGTVTINSDSVYVASINASGGTNGGGVTIDAQDIEVGAIDTSGAAFGGAITLRATDNNTSGTPSIILNGDINTQDTTDASDNGVVDISLNGSDVQTSQLTINHAGLFTSSLSVTGNTGVDTLLVSSGDNTWNIDGSDQGNVGSTSFTGFENLTGGTGNDSFVFGAGGSLSGNLTGGDGTDTIDYSALTSVSVNLTSLNTIEAIIGNGTDSTIVGDNNNNTWNITGADDGNVAGIDFTDFNNLTGGSGNDTFVFGASGSLSGNIVGGDGTDAIDYSALSSVSVDLATLNTIEAIIGNGTDSSIVGDNNDNSWNITGSDSGNVAGITFADFNNLTGGTGNDSFVFGVGGSLSGNLTGGDGSDTIDYSALASVSVDINTLNEIEDLVGNGSDSTLLGGDTDNTWNITGSNAGDIAGLTFSGFNNLTGGAGNDSFVFGANGSLSGIIDGGTGGTNSIDYSVVTGTVVAYLSNILNISSLIGNGANATLVGINSDATWNLSGANAGDVAGVSFTGFNNLTGGTGNDSFVFGAGGSLSGNLTGGDGTDTIDYSALTSVSVNLTSLNTIEAIIGNGADSTIVGDNNNNTWNITDTDDGNVAGIDFTDFNNLTGGTGNDTFVFGTSGSLSGNLTGGDGTDTIDYSALTSVLVDITTLSSIEGLIGNGTDSTLVGDNGNNTWNINGANDGNVAGIDFTDFNNLTGGTGNDTFVFGAGGSLSGSISGGDGSDTINYSALSSVVVDLTSLNEIESVIGNGSDSTLLGSDSDSSWNITASNAGNVAGVTFTDFNNLTGGAGNDSFVFGANGSLSGIIDGGTGGTNSIDYSVVTGTVVAYLSNILNISSLIGNGANATLVGINSDATWNLSGANAGDVAGVSFTGFNNLTGGTGNDSFVFGAGGSLSGNLTGGDGTDTIDYSALTSVSVNLTSLNTIEAIIGNGADSTIVGDNNNNTWNITDTDDGNVAGIDFTDFNNLTGGTGNDTFVFGTSGSLSGNLTGGDGTDTIDYSALTSVLVDITTLSSIEGLIGNGTDSTLVGDNGNNTWNINGANDGNVAGIDFTDFNNLTGGTGNDTFVFGAGGSLSGSISGGDGSDTINYSALSSVVVDLTSLNEIESVIGNGSDSTLLGSDSDSSWNITASNAGNVAGVTFTDFNNLTGGAGNDSFVFGASGSLSGSIDGGSGTDSIDYSALSSVWVDVTSLTQIESILGNGVDSTLYGGNANNSWSITGSNIGDVGGIAFDGFNNLTGGTGNDTFIFEINGDLSGNLTGGNGYDTIDYSALASVSVDLTTLNEIEALVGNDIDSTIIGDNNNNTWNVNGLNQGSVSGIDFTGFNNLSGGTGNDTFVFSASGSLSGNLLGGAGSDTIDYSALSSVMVDITTLNSIESLIGNAIDSTLFGGNGNNTWSITGNDSGNVAGISFTDFNNLTGGTGNDTFVFSLNSSLSGNLFGGDGTDTINYSNLNNVLVDITTLNSIEAVIGNGTNSTLFGGSSDNTWNINGANSGSVAGITFTDFNNLTGGTGSDTFIFGINGNLTGILTGGNGTGIDTIDYSALTTVSVDLTTLNQIEALVGNGTDSTLIGDNSDSIWNITGTDSGDVAGVSFTDFNNLTGGSGSDTFIYDVNGSLSGSLTGGNGSGTDTIDYSALLSVVVNINTLNEIEALIGNGADSTIVGTNSGDTWNITGSDVGSVAGIDFSGFNNLTGGAGNDTFVFSAAGNLSGNLLGGAGTDTIDYSALSSVLVDINTLNSIEALIGNGFDSTIVGTNSGDTWNITGNDVGNVAGINFTGFNNLTGGTGSDNFVFGLNGSLTGNLFGGAGVDTIDYSALASVLVNLNTLNEIEALIGNGTDSTIVGTNTGDTWNISNSNIGNVAGIDFSGFNNLTGGSGNDTFVFGTNGNLSGNLVGGDGYDTIDYSALANVIVDINSLNEIEALVGNGSNSTIIGTNSGDTWNITGSNIGNVAGIDFTDFNNLTGGTGNDIFVFGANGSLSGSLAGGNGSDTIDYSALSQVMVNISSLNSIEALIGNGTDSTLVGNNSSNTWNITGLNDGDVAGIDFTDFNNLTGGTGTDQFVFEAAGQITGIIDGGAGAGVNDFVDLTAINSDLSLGVDGSASADVNIIGVERVDANSNFNNVLVAGDVNNVWTVNGTNSGTLAFSTQSLIFSGFANLTGGSANDTFNLNGSDHITGLINGGGGANDELNILSLGRDITVQLGPNAGASDSGVLYVTGVESIRANSSNDNTIIGQSISSNWSIDTANTSSVAYTQSPTDETTVTFSGFNQIQGGLSDDTFVILDASNLLQIVGGDGAGNDLIDYSNTLSDININIGGSLGPDGVTINGIEGLIGNNDGSTGSFNSQITVNDGNNTWTLFDFDGNGIADGINDGIFQDQAGNTISFINFNILQGGSGADIFNVNNGASITGYVHGGAGNDQLNLSLNQAGQFNFVGGSGTDSVLLTGGNSSFDAYYTSDVNGYEQLEYTNSSGASYAVSYSGVESVTDEVVATNFTIYGSAAQDTIALSTGYVSVNNNTAINFSNRTNLILSGETIDVFDLVGDLNLGTGNLRLENSSLTNTSSATLRANRLIVASSSGVGSEQSRINTDINQLTILNNSSDIYLNEANDIQLMNVSTSGVLNLLAGRDVTQSNSSILTSNNDFIISSGRNITLNRSNQLSGDVSLIAGSNIEFVNSLATNFERIEATNLNLSINGDITDSGNIIVTSTTILDANGSDILLDSSGNNFNNLSVNSAENLLLSDIGQLTLNNMNVANRIEVNAENVTVSQDISTNEMLFNASGTVQLNSDLTTNNGDLVISASTIGQNGALLSAADIALSATQNILMSEGASSVTSSGDIRYVAGNNLNISSLQSSSGEVQLEATNGAVFDANGALDNIVASRAEIIAHSGIGATDALETQLSNLFAENDEGAIRFNNRGSIVLERLATLGNIEFNNSDMDGSDIYFMANSVDAGYDVGVLTMTTEGGSFLGLGAIPSFENADIVAREASFIDTLRLGTFGGFDRPLVLRIRDSVIISVRTSLNPLFSDPQPEINTSDSLFSFSSFDTIAAIAGGQFVVVEELEDVDPAIFTDVRNYNHDEVAVKLPRDQLYEDEEDTMVGAGSL